MCGILGEFVFNGRLTDKETFGQLNELSRHRGPDKEGFYSNNEYCQLGFNRLSILDLSPLGMQPMTSPSGRYKVVFNGEIYNHLDLRSSLFPTHAYHGTSDTATLCACLDAWGVDKTVPKLDGMFAIGIVDELEKKVHLVRDFAGIKPLFYGLDHERIVFASQYDQVAIHPGFRNHPIDASVLKLYLLQHFMPAPFGIIQGTGQVLPGEILSVDLKGKVQQKRFWEFPDYQEPNICNPQAALEFIENELRESVRSEMLSDVPLGAFLSGGIDSPLVCYFAQEALNTPLKTFTIGSDSNVHDESELAGRYATMIRSEHVLEQMFSSFSRTNMELALAAMHEPMADFSIVPTFCVSQLARKNVTVALSGDGGDELFFGYERFWSLAKNRKFHHYPYILRRAIYLSDRIYSRNKYINSALLMPSQSVAHKGSHSRFPIGLIDTLFPDLGTVQEPATYDVYRYENTSDENRLIQSMRKAEFYGMMQKTLRKVDLASMQNSLEVRVPFLKKSFIESSLRVDPFLSYGKDRKKELLKNLLVKLLPQSPIDNVKRGFSIPLTRWLRQDLYPMFSDYFMSSRLADFGIVTAEAGKMLEKHVQGEKDLKWPLFTILALLAWREKMR